MLSLNKFRHFARFYLLVLLVGMVAGLGAIVFRQLIAFFHNLLFYGVFSLDYDVLQHAAASTWGMGIIFVPVIGAILVAFLIKNYAPEAKGHGVPEAMDAIYYEHGIIRPVVALIKSIASSITIGSGGSVGREGPIIQIGAAFGSSIAQWMNVPKWERITLIACGAGGGIAATFNAPVGGVLFALEIMLPELSPRSIIPVTLATAVATYISYIKFGTGAFIPLNTTAVSQIFVPEILSYIVLSLFLGLLSAIFIRSIYFSEDTFDNLRGGYYLRHMTGMFLVGISMYLMMRYTGHYYIQGVGYATILDILTGMMTHPAFLLLLALLKLIDTAITLGSGGSGGIFSPLMFIGACLGACFALLCQSLFPGQIDISIQFGALAGIAGMVGASTGAPLTAIIMTSELTNDYTTLLPLMLIVTISSGIRRAIMKDSVYTLKLTRRGHRIPDRLKNMNASSR